MNPFKLEGTDPRGRHAEVWACGNCRYVRHEEADAERCCTPPIYPCRGGCGATVPYTQGECPACARARINKEEADDYEKAEKVPVLKYDGEHVCLLGGTYKSVEDVLDDEEEDQPAWAWAVTYMGVPRIDAAELMYDKLEEYYDGASEDLDIEDLQKRIDKWCDAQDFTAYIEDRSRVVVFKKEEEDDDPDETEEGVPE